MSRRFCGKRFLRRIYRRTLRRAFGRISRESMAHLSFEDEIGSQLRELPRELVIADIGSGSTRYLNETDYLGISISGALLTRASIIYSENLEKLM